MVPRLWLPVSERPRYPINRRQLTLPSFARPRSSKDWPWPSSLDPTAPCGADHARGNGRRRNPRGDMAPCGGRDLNAVAGLTALASGSSTRSNSVCDERPTPGLGHKHASGSRHGVRGRGVHHHRRRDPVRLVRTIRQRRSRRPASWRVADPNSRNGSRRRPGRQRLRRAALRRRGHGRSGGTAMASRLPRSHGGPTGDEQDRRRCGRGDGILLLVYAVVGSSRWKSTDRSTTRSTLWCAHRGDNTGVSSHLGQWRGARLQ